MAQRLPLVARRWVVVAGLRRWAEGSLTDLAAVELLASCSRGRFVDPACPWVRECRRPGWCWLDPDRLHAGHGPPTADQQRVVALAVVLLGGATKRTGTTAKESVGRWAA